jgi:hypothetical protein
MICVKEISLHFTPFPMPMNEYSIIYSNEDEMGFDVFSLSQNTACI